MKFNVNRRRFVQLMGALSAGWSGIRAEAHQAVSKPQPANVSANTFVNQTVNRKNLVATQVKAYAWLDEGIDRLLDNLQGKGTLTPS